MNLVFDIETDGLDATKIWCIVAYDVDTHKVYSYGPDDIQKNGLNLLSKADKLIGHNILGFDIPVIKKLYNIDLSGKQLVDTLVLSRLFNPVREGNHSLESWGYRLGSHKDTKPEDFTVYTPAMLDYCKIDVLLTAQLYTHLKGESKGFTIESVDLEHNVSRILKRQREHGFLLDVKAAEILLAQLSDRLESIEDKVQKDMYQEPEVIELMPTLTKTGKISKMAQYGNTRVRLTDLEYEEITKKAVNGGYISVSRVEEKVFNLGSRKQIGEYLSTFGWVPKKFTPTGQPIVDEATLRDIEDIPQAQLIADFLMLQKRIAQIASWVEASEEDNRVRGFVNHNGTITGRMTHGTST